MKASSLTNWPDFLREWEQEALEILTSFQLINPSNLTIREEEFLLKRKLFSSGATQEQIQLLENRLVRTLPPSYVEFLQTSNGGTILAMDADDGLLWPTEQVNWFIEQDPQWVEAWVREHNYEVPDHLYLVYGEEQDCVHLRTEYLHTALAISDSQDSAVYLLNPQIVTPSGEWEAWYFNNKLPGAIRYPSFIEMMIAERQRTLKDLKDSCNVP
ncbi:MAG: SMI1/KNR4 family protein [Microcystaceae cyanobacterium]